MEKTKTNYTFIAIVAIVAIVALVVMTSGVGNKVVKVNDNQGGDAAVSRQVRSATCGGESCSSTNSCPDGCACIDSNAGSCEANEQCYCGTPVNILAPNTGGIGGGISCEESCAEYCEDEPEGTIDDCIDSCIGLNCYQQK